MNNQPKQPLKNASHYAEQVGTKGARKLKAQRNATPGIWFGLGMVGLIGWSVVVPTILGALLGAWLDKHHPGQHSWTLALLVAGLSIGCLNAWLWVDKQDKAMRDSHTDNFREDNDE